MIISEPYILPNQLHNAFVRNVGSSDLAGSAVVAQTASTHTDVVVPDGAGAPSSTAVTDAGNAHLDVVHGGGRAVKDTLRQNKH